MSMHAAALPCKSGDSHVWYTYMHAVFRVSCVNLDATISTYALTIYARGAPKLCKTKPSQPGQALQSNHPHWTAPARAFNAERAVKAGRQGENGAG